MKKAKQPWIRTQRPMKKTARGWDPKAHEEDSQGLGPKRPMKKTARDWDPRTHDRKSSASRRTSAKISTRNARSGSERCCPRARRAGDWETHLNVSAQDKSNQIPITENESSVRDRMVQEAENNRRRGQRVEGRGRERFGERGEVRTR